MKKLLDLFTIDKNFKDKKLSDFTLLDCIRVCILIDIVFFVISLFIPGQYTFFEYAIFGTASFVIAILGWAVTHYHTKKVPWLFLVGAMVLILLIPLMGKIMPTSQQPIATESYVEKSKDYQQAVTTFNKNNATQIEEKISNGDTFYLYIGRESCPFCQDFAPLLKKASTEVKQTIDYFDAESPSKKDDQLLDQLDIHSFPMLLKISEGHIIKTFDTEAEYQVANIIDFLK